MLLITICLKERNNTADSKLIKQAGQSGTHLQCQHLGAEAGGLQVSGQDGLERETLSQNPKINHDHNPKTVSIVDDSAKEKNIQKTNCKHSRHREISLTGLESSDVKHEAKASFCNWTLEMSYSPACADFSQVSSHLLVTHGLVNTSAFLWGATPTQLSQRPQRKDKGNLVLCPCPQVDLARPV